MKKCSFLLVCAFLLTFADLNAEMKLSLSNNYLKESGFNTAAGDRLKFGRSDLKSPLRLTIPESVIKTQSIDQAKMYAILQLVVALPTGDFGDAYNTGIGVNGTFAYMLYSYLVLTGSLGYVSWGADSELEGFGDASVSSVPFLVGIRYLFNSASAFTPYALGEIGLHFMSWNYESEFEGFGGLDFDQSSTEFCLGLGGGFMYPLSAMLLLDVNLRYWIISDAGNLALMAGIAYALGGM